MRLLGVVNVEGKSPQAIRAIGEIEKAVMALPIAKQVTIEFSWNLKLERR